MKNLRIGQRLALAFGALIALVLIMSVVMLNGLSSISDGMEDITDNRLESLLIVAQLDHHLQQQRIGARDLIIETDPAKMAEIKAQTDQTIKPSTTPKKRWKTTSPSFRPCPLPPPCSKTWARLRKRWTRPLKS
ncbi:MCP four helix bundle domain-containing protein [Chromobacterium haemolyticum]|uniref:MCP four helix bundle domain-containing protein n=1 Tax=Chromobacterium haemolyticum TaxID=394935 RepID=UPI000DEF77F8|nr:MCP four helix bundle domain-containing protein [Chromobacterium haemolyticum]